MMPYEQNFSDKFEALRDQAEALVGRRPGSAPPPPADVLELIDELKIHQAELEIQNEEPKRTQGELSDLHREYERLYEFAPCGYLTLNAKRIVTRANLTAGDLLGETKPGLLCSGIGRFVAPGWLDHYHDALHNAAKTGEKQCIELMLKKTNGSTGWVRADIEADRDDAGAAMQWRMVLLDTTENKEMEARLHHARKMETIGWKKRAGPSISPPKSRP